MRFTHKKRQRGAATGGDSEGIELQSPTPQYVEATFFQHEFAVPDSMHDSESAHQPYASQGARAALIAKLLGEPQAYRDALREISDANPELCLALKHCTMSSTQYRRQQRMALERFNERPHDEADVAAEQRRHMRLELLLSTTLRIRNQFIPTFANVCLSLRCLKAGVPRAVWDMLSMARTCMSYDWTRDLALEVGSALGEWPRDGTSSTVGFAVADNCAYQINLTFEHLEDDGEFLQTVNWLSVPLFGRNGGPPPEIQGAHTLKQAHACSVCCLCAV